MAAAALTLSCLITTHPSGGMQSPRLRFTVHSYWCNIVPRTLSASATLSAFLVELVATSRLRFFPALGRASASASAAVFEWVSGALTLAAISFVSFFAILDCSTYK